MQIPTRMAVAVVLAASLHPALAETAGTPEDAAQKSAEVWLALVDAEQYGESWEASSALLRGAVSKERWAEMAAGVRKPLGKLVSRKVKSRTSRETLPGAPDGKYVVIQFESSFENKKAAVETVTPALEGTRGWRVSGYFLQ